MAHAVFLRLAALRAARAPPRGRTSNARPQGNFWDLSEPDPPSISPVSMPASSILHVPSAGFNKDIENEQKWVILGYFAH